jgi:aryl carrier-like protein
MQANQPFLSMGLDSIMAMEISNQINKKTGIEVPIYKLLDDMTIDELISYVKSGSENVQNNTFKAADLIQEDVGDWEDEIIPKGVNDYLGDINNLSEDRIDRILSLLSNN